MEKNKNMKFLRNFNSLICEDVTSKSRNLNRFEKLEKNFIILDSFVLVLFCMIVLLIGSMTNFAVMLRNNGKMPIYLSYEFIDETYFSFQDFSSEEVNYPYLADIIWLNNYVMSVGDIIIYLSFLFLTIVLINYRLNLMKFNKQKHLKTSKSLIS